ncbi:MAG: hypothetical protein J4N89_10775 [Chloroflexi bacterium]|nr:hypothetical protein [Chloroflexota bacterium]MCI0785504.1 hypothetical protein [Chloroflexota bacterium]MCI0798671.1 hypothetical protein [Chloroflexota bacterium]MCI0824996.1 hypothetical protein [Chloroflexota bacterium]MCI0867016.1 hypothetical protein [Chloroflexota bacterium]
MQGVISTALLLIASVIAATGLINAVLPAANKSSGALLAANSVAADRIKTDIEIVHASGNDTSNKITLWVKNIGTKNIAPISASDVILTTPSDILRLPYVSGCSSECWDYLVEDSGSDWKQSVTVKFTLSTSVTTGVYTITLSVVNAVSAVKDFSV